MKTAQLHHEYQPEKFSFTPQNMEKIHAIFAKYPAGRHKSTVMPLLHLAQVQVAERGPYGPYEEGGGWVPRAAMDEVARIVGVPPIKVYEVATFYTMYNLHPVGKYLIQICTTSPCMLGGIGSDVIVNTFRAHLGIDFEQTTPDGLFTMKDVECLGACVNAPVIQINDDYYEDLSPERVIDIIEALRSGQKPKTGSQTGRMGSCPVTGPTTLKDMVQNG
ncbi:MAG: NADH-ubiquinone oxidoreductase chain [Alphaproteobacteria bacterium]|nr:NADH-ubiquinone oxidoreductase chain [Alphaproteobacteria bacterium]